MKRTTNFCTMSVTRPNHCEDTMPIPTPNAGETEAEFIRRCMANDTMLEDFDDNGQRFAVCQSSWDESKGVVQHSQMESDPKAASK